MVELKANFKGKYEDLNSPVSRRKDETTDHVIQCEECQKITWHKLPTPAQWNNLDWQEEAREVYEQIEDSDFCKENERKKHWNQSALLIRIFCKPKMFMENFLADLIQVRK